MHPKVFTTSALLGGTLLLAEGVASPWLEPHWQYHALDVPMSLVLAIALGSLLRGQAAAWGRLARVGAWIGLAAAGIAGLGGIYPLVTEPFGIGASPDALEGVVHSAALGLFLGLGLLGLGAFRAKGAPRMALLVTAVPSLAAVAMVIAGLDSPWVFLVPEILVGVGFAWLGVASSQSQPSPAARMADA